MIRRGFWLTAGAVLGITGYRRVTRLASALAVPRAPGIRSLPGTGPTAGPQMLAPPAPRRSTAAPRRSTAARVVAAARFVQDVRDGMAEYRDLHRDEPNSGRQSRTLESQGHPALSASQQGPREP
jgi:hypothetical protein